MVLTTRRRGWKSGLGGVHQNDEESGSRAVFEDGSEQEGCQGLRARCGR